MSKKAVSSRRNQKDKTAKTPRPLPVKKGFYYRAKAIGQIMLAGGYPNATTLAYELEVTPRTINATSRTCRKSITASPTTRTATASTLPARSPATSS